MILPLDAETRAALPGVLPLWRLVEGRDAIRRDFRFADFSAAWLTDSHFERAGLDGARFDEAQADGVCFRGARAVAAGAGCSAEGIRP